MENVFSKTQEIVLLKNLANREASSGILELKSFASIHFNSKELAKIIERRKTKPSGKTRKKWQDWKIR